MIFCISAFESITIIFFFFYNTPTTEIYTLSLHDALPISVSAGTCARAATGTRRLATCAGGGCDTIEQRGLPHTLSSLPAGAASAFGRRPTIPGAEGLGIDPPESPPRTAQGRAAICRRDQGRLLTAGSCGAHRCVAVAGGQPEAGIRAAPVNAAILDALRARAHAIGHGRERCDRTGAPDGTGGWLGRANRARHGCARGGLGQAPAIGHPRLSPEVPASLRTRWSTPRDFSASNGFWIKAEPLSSTSAPISSVCAHAMVNTTRPASRSVTATDPIVEFAAP